MGDVTVATSASFIQSTAVTQPNKISVCPVSSELTLPHYTQASKASDPPLTNVNVDEL